MMSMELGAEERAIYKSLQDRRKNENQRKAKTRIHRHIASTEAIRAIDVHPFRHSPLFL